MQEFYTVSEARSGAYRIYSAENVYCEVLVGGEKAMLIDTGHGYGDLKAVVEGIIKGKPLIVVNTHGHVDHTCGNARFNCPVYIGEEDMELCRIHTSEDLRRHVAEGSEWVTNWQTGEKVRGLPPGFDIEQYAALGSGELVPVRDGEVFELGGMTIRVIATPGHTRGGRSFLWEQEQVLYVGDAANPFLWLFSDESTDRKTHIATLDRLIALAPKAVYGSHNPKIMTVEDLERFKRVAETADYDKGFPFESSVSEDGSARVCCLDGMTPSDSGKPGYASIVISKDR